MPGLKYDLRTFGGADGTLGSLTVAADNDTAAWNKCVTAALNDKWYTGPSGAAQGVITIPAGKYRIGGADWPSNLRLEPDAGASISIWGSSTAYVFGWGAAGSQIVNVSISGTGSTLANKPTATSFWTGSVPLPFVSVNTGITWPLASLFVADMNRAVVGGKADAHWITLGYVDHFLIENMLGRQCAEGQDEGNATCSKAPILFFHNQASGTLTNLKHPTNGTIQTCGCIDAPQGYGLTGYNSGSAIVQRNVWEVGGDPGRCETGQANGHVQNVTFDSIECINGSCCVAISPHNQDNGKITGRNLWSTECESAVKVSKGTGGSFAAGTSFSCVKAMGGNTDWPAALIAAGGDPEFAGVQKGLAQWDNPADTNKWLLGKSRKGIYFNGSGGWMDTNVAWTTISCQTGPFDSASAIACSTVTPCSVGTPPPPAPVLTSTPDAVTTATTATFAAIDGQSGTFNWQIDGGGYVAGAVGTSDTKTYSALAAGNHQCDVKVVNANGTSPVTSFLWTVNTAPPPAPPTITAQPTAISLTSAPTFSWTLPGGTTSQTSLDGAAFANQASPYSPTGLAIGTHTLLVHSVDGGGQTSTPVTISWQIVDSGVVDATGTIGGTTLADEGAAWHWAAATTLDLGLPINAAAGQVAYAAIASLNTGAITPPSGWTELTNSPQSAGTAVKVAVYRRILDGTETSPVRWTLPAAKGGGIIYCLGNAYTTANAPESGTPHAATDGAGSTTATNTGVTTVADQSVTLLVTAADHYTTVSPPAGYTEIADIGQNLTGIGSPGLLHLCRGLQAVAGATGAVTATLANSSKWAQLMFAVQPARIALTITNPAADVTITGVAGDTITLTGTVSSDLGITGLTVNGKAVTINADDSWSDVETLAVGSNTYTIVATQTGGQTETQTRVVIVANPTTPTTIDLSTDAERIALLVRQVGIDPHR